MAYSPSSIQTRTDNDNISRNVNFTITKIEITNNLKILFTSVITNIHPCQPLVGCHRLRISLSESRILKISPASPTPTHPSPQ